MTLAEEVERGIKGKALLKILKLRKCLFSRIWTRDSFIDRRTRKP